MAKGDEQLRGALLEEAILYLLRRSGYKVVLSAGTDPTLKPGGAGLEIRGRGSWHQIDAISDFRVTPPFTNPQRLLVEGKCLSKSVGLPIVRNGVGVLKDVSENWLLTAGMTIPIPKKRHHYLYAIFSATDFTAPAQDYAFAHDIPLLPLKRSAFFRPIVEAIERVTRDDLRAPASLKEIRGYVRGRLLGNDYDAEWEGELEPWLEEYFGSCGGLSLGFITMFGGQFPAFLVARDRHALQEIDGPVAVRIRWRDGFWFIEEAVTGNEIFSFDLPEELFDLYAEQGRLNRENVVNIKSDIMREFYAFHSANDQVRLVTFRLDEAWFDALGRQNRG